MAMIQLTNAGVALIESNTGPVVVDTFQLGSDYDYTPEPTDIGIHGTEVYSGIPTNPIAVNANIVKYSIFIDYPLGPFQFGEFGLYVGPTLFALGTTSELVQKLALTSVDPGNALRIDIYLSMVGTNYAMWLDLNQSNNSFRMGVLQSPDYLPPSSGAVPNAYVVQGANVSQSAFLAYTDTNGLWNFDAYDFAQQAAATVTATDNSSVTIAFSDYAVGMSPEYFGEVILQFATGALYGIVRYVSSAVISGDTVTLGFATPVAMLPEVGDQFLVFGRRILSTTVANLPIATSAQLGAVIVGSTLTIDAYGNLNVNDAMIPVRSVNGQTGDVELTATDIIDIAKVAITGQYTDLLNYPAAYTLPPATTVVLGGVKAPSTSEGTLTIAIDGTIDLAFNPVKTVNGLEPDPSTGDVEIPIPIATGLINALSLSASTDLNTVTGVGLYYVTSANIATIVNLPISITTEFTLEVVPLYTVGTPGDVIQRVSTGTQMTTRSWVSGVWGNWAQVGMLQTHLEQSIVASTPGQTLFVTAGYNPNYIEVFLAGLRLTPAMDYSATDGTNINIINAALSAQINVGAEMTVSSYNLFDVTDAAQSTALASPTGAYLIGYDSTYLGTTTVGATLDNLLSVPASVSVDTTTPGQTAYTIPGGYTQNLINVYYGPYFLLPGIDYTATDGETVHLVTITGTVGSYLTVQNVRGIDVANAVAASTLGAAGGAGLVGYGNSTVAATLNEFASSNGASTIGFDSTTVGATLTEIVNGTATDAGTLTGTETLPLSRGSGILQTTLTKVAQWAIQTFQGFMQIGTGAVARTVESKLQERVSVLDFGADPTGVADSSTAFQAAVNALLSAGGTISVPYGMYKVNTAPTWGTKTVYWNIDPAATITGTQTTFPAMVTNNGVIPVGPWMVNQSPVVATQYNGTASFAVEAIQPSTLNGGVSAYYGGVQLNSAGANSIGLVANFVATANAGSSGNIWGLEIDVGMYAPTGTGTQFGLSLNGEGTGNPTYGIKMQRADTSLWQYGLDIRNAITGLSIENTTGLTNGIVVGQIPVVYPNIAVAAGQLANNGEILLMQRFTDTAPTGYFINAVNAANTAQLFSVDIAGNLIATSGTLATLTVSGITNAAAVNATALTASAQVVTSGLNYQQPTTSFNIQMLNTDSTVILDPLGTLATGTLFLPVAPLNGQRVSITSTQTISAFTLSPGGAQTVKNAPTALTPITTNGGLIGVEYIYQALNTTWYRL